MKRHDQCLMHVLTESGNTLTQLPNQKQAHANHNVRRSTTGESDIVRQQKAVSPDTICFMFSLHMHVTHINIATYLPRKVLKLQPLYLEFIIIAQRVFKLIEL